MRCVCGRPGWCKGVREQNSMRCSCTGVSGLFVAAPAAGPDGFRDPLPNGRATFLATTLHGLCGSSDRPISIFSSSPAPAADERSGGGRRRPVGFPLVIMAHTMRAILLAKATAASLRGLRPSRLSSHCETAGRPGLACWITAVAPSTSSCRSRSSPARLMPPSRCLPAVEHSRGTRPTRPRSGAPIELRRIDPQRKAQRPDWPDPRIAASRRRPGRLVLLHQRGIDRPPPHLNALGLRRTARSPLLPPAHAGVIGRGDLGPQLGHALLAERRHDPHLGGMAAHRVDQLGALPHQELGTHNSIAAACCSADFTGTLLIDGLVAATPIASASLGRSCRA